MIKDKLPELPKGWVWTRVGEIYNIVGGGTPSTSIPEYWDGEIPWITSADIYGLKDIRPRRKINKEAIENSSTNLVPENSLIVVTRVGLGKVALAKTPLCFSQDSQALIGNSSFVNPNYSLYYLYQAVQIFKFRHRGTTIAGVPKSQLASLPFAFPPLPEQNRIVTKIEELFIKLDAAVESLKKVKAQLNRYRQAVLKYAFEGKLTEEWREASKEKLEPASILLELEKEERKKNTKGKYKELNPLTTLSLPVLPEGWFWVRLENCCSLITKGESPNWQGFKYEDIGIPFIRSENVLWGKLDFSSTVKIPREFHEKLKRSHIKGNDVLINLVGASIGRCGIVPSTFTDANVNQAVAVIRVNNFLVPGYLMYLILSPPMQKIIHNSKVETARPNISLGDLHNLVIPLPTLLEQQKIVQEIEFRFSIADEVEKVADHSLRQSEKLRQSILKKAFEGKLVPQDPSNEPAEKLLERIKAEREKFQPKKGKGRRSKA